MNPKTFVIICAALAVVFYAIGYTLTSVIAPAIMRKLDKKHELKEALNASNEFKEMIEKCSNNISLEDLDKF